MKGRPARLALACLLSAALSGCVVASPDADTYRDAAATTLGAAVSEISTAQKLLTLLDSDRIPRAAAVTQLRDSEESLAAAVDGLTRLNPPRSQDQIERAVGQALEGAESSLQAARLAVHRSRTTDYAAIVDDLDTVASELEDLEGDAS